MNDDRVIGFIKNMIAMPGNFQQNFIHLKTTIEKRQYDKLAKFSLEVPDRFNWMRDVFEPSLADINPEQNMLEHFFNTLIIYSRSFS
jgi:hypothetical protein